MRQPAQEIQFGLHPPQNLLMRHEELYVAGRPDVTNCGTAKVAEERNVGDDEGSQKDEDQGGRPGRNLVRTDAVDSSVGAIAMVE